MYIYQSDIKDFFFIKLLQSGVATDDADLTLISEIVFDYLVAVGILDPNSILSEDEFTEDED